jgi:serine/threonine-protein kinase RsbW
LQEARIIEVDIPNDIAQIERVVELVQFECRQMAFGSRQVMLNVPVALTEALSNAILRGNKDDPRKHVHVRAEVGSDLLVLEVADEGQGFDLEGSTIDPTTPENVEREDGRGLFLMQKLMDTVERFGAQERNVVRLTLHRA